MTDKLKSLDKFLNLLFIFLFPSQLALHFWPSFSLIFGIRVDYLAPTIYLTDVLFFILFVWWLAKSGREFLEDINKKKLLLFLVLIVSILNIIISASPIVTLLKWIKISELLVLGYYVKKRSDLFNVKIVARVIFYSLLFFCSIGLLQFLSGQTFGKIFYLVGERSFSVFTPGIALAEIFGKNYLRAYSTFSHPNALAGFLGVCLLFLLPNVTLKNKWIKVVGYTLIVAVFILTFSLSAFIALFLSSLFYLLNKKLVLNIRHLSFILVSIFSVSLLLTYFSKPILIGNQNLPQSVSQRLELADVAGNIFSKNWLVGTGLNTFILKEIDFAEDINNVWFLQPVHNTYLLIFTESGILGTVIIFTLFYKLFNRGLKSRSFWGLSIIVSILVTGLFDHYWLTSQQNLLIASFFSGLMFRKK